MHEFIELEKVELAIKDYLLYVCSTDTRKFQSKLSPIIDEINFKKEVIEKVCVIGNLRFKLMDEINKNLLIGNDNTRKMYLNIVKSKIPVSELALQPFEISLPFTFNSIRISITEFIDNKLRALQPQPTEQQNEHTDEVIKALNKYKFTEYLSQKNIDTNKIFQLVRKHSGKDLMPYSIALLSEIKYLDYFFGEFTKTKVEGFKKLGKVFNVNERRIKGNVNILNSGSNEDSTQYTSYQHKENIQKELKGL